MTSSVLTIILNYRTPRLTLQSAQAAHKAMTGIEGMIVIVDNDSGDGSFEFLRDATKDLSRVRVLSSGRNGGFGAGNNFGIRAGLAGGARPGFVYLLNPDAFARPDTIRILRDYMVAHPDCGFAGSNVVGEDGAPHIASFRFPSILSELEGAAHTGAISRLLGRHGIAHPIPTKPEGVDWVSGASVMLRMDMLDRVGLFDEQFFLYFEETDLCRRARDAGWTGVAVPDAVVTHVGSASTGMGDWRRTPEYWFASRARYFLKHHGAAYLAVATLAHLAGGVLWKTRRLIERKPDRIAPHFLTDLACHTTAHLRNRSLPPPTGLNLRV